MVASKVNWTTQRKVIFDLICASPNHPTANDIMDRLRGTGHQFAYGTVYNSLRYLVDAGLITELKLGDASSRYDGRTEDHLHLRCSQCGRIEEAALDIPSEWLDTVKEQTGFSVQKLDVVLHGLCSACRSHSA